MTKERNWSGLSRGEKIANVLYPGNAERSLQGEMKQLLAAEGKQPAASSLLSDAQRGAVSPLGGAIRR